MVHLGQLFKRPGHIKIIDMVTSKALSMASVQFSKYARLAASLHFDPALSTFTSSPIHSLFLVCVPLAAILNAGESHHSSQLTPKVTVSESTESTGISFLFSPGTSIVLGDHLPFMLISIYCT